MSVAIEDVKLWETARLRAEIERLRAENERLRAIIENVALAIGADTTLVDEQ
jgi:hypothetical protein